MGLLVDLELDSGRCGEGGMSVMGDGCIFCVERDGDDGPGGSALRLLPAFDSYHSIAFFASDRVRLPCLSCCGGPP